VEAQKIAEKKSGDTARSNYEAEEADFPQKKGLRRNSVEKTTKWPTKEKNPSAVVVPSTGPDTI